MELLASAGGRVPRSPVCASWRDQSAYLQPFVWPRAAQRVVRGQLQRRRSPAARQRLGLRLRDAELSEARCRIARVPLVVCISANTIVQAGACWLPIPCAYFESKAPPKIGATSHKLTRLALWRCFRRCIPADQRQQQPKQTAQQALSQCTPDFMGVGTCTPDALQDGCASVRAYGNRRCWDAQQQGSLETFWGYRFGPSSRCLPVRTHHPPTVRPRPANGPPVKSGRPCCLLMVALLAAQVSNAETWAKSSSDRTVVSQPGDDGCFEVSCAPGTSSSTGALLCTGCPSHSSPVVSFLSPLALILFLSTVL